MSRSGPSQQTAKCGKIRIHPIRTGTIQMRLQIASLKAIRALARERPMIYLATHGPDAEHRRRDLDASMD